MTGRPMVDVVAGARPNFVKIASILPALLALGERAPRVRLVHTGQHHDPALSASFFDQLGLPEPDVHLGARGETAGEQTGAIMVAYERVLAREASALCLVVGDVTSTLACALTARRANVPLAHVEAGLRSGDRSMPEEINRIATDAISDWFFTTSETAGANLRREGVAPERIHFVGNTMIDTLLANLGRLREPDLRAPMGLQDGRYLVLTLHRPANVDDPKRLKALLQAMSRSAGDWPVVFPVHPRTASRLGGIGALPAGIHPVPPQPYLEFNHLVRGAGAVVTDSGGITEEATVLQVPCITLRDRTERPETVTMGTNRLVGADAARLADALRRVRAGQWPRGAVPERWDGRAGERIAQALHAILEAGAA